jgi:hypothetical protein
MTKTGNSSFRKIRKAEGSDGLNVSEGTVGSLVVDKLVVDRVLPGRFGDVKTITGYTPTEFIGIQGSFWLNLSAGLPNAVTSGSAGILSLPVGSRVVAVTATTPDTTPVTPPAVNVSLGPQSFATFPSAPSVTIIAVSSSALFTLPGCEVGATPTITTPLGAVAGPVPVALPAALAVTGVTVTTDGTVSAGSLVVTIYYV